VNIAPALAAAPRRTALLVVAVCAAFNFVSRGVTESFAVYVLPLAREFGGDRGAVVSIQSICMLAYGLSGPVVGRLFDRYGPRLTFAVGLGLVGGGLSLAPHADALWQLRLTLGLMVGAGAGALGIVTTAALVARWIGGRRALANSVLYAAAGVGVLVLVPLAQGLVELTGWRGATQALGVGTLLLVLPVLLLPWATFSVGSAAMPAPASGGLTLRDAFGQLAFWALFLAYLFTAIGMYCVTVQVVAFLVEAGFAPLKAASAWGMSGILLPLGMLLFGWLDTRIGRRAAMLLSYVLSMGGVVLLWGLGLDPSEFLLAAFVVVFGGTVGARGPLLSSVAMALFRGRSAATIFGTISIGGGGGAAIGIWLSGLLHDWSGGYDLGLAVAFFSLFLGLLPYLLVPALRKAN